MKLIHIFYHKFLLLCVISDNGPIHEERRSPITEKRPFVEVL